MGMSSPRGNYGYRPPTPQAHSSSTGESGSGNYRTTTHWGSLYLTLSGERTHTPPDPLERTGIRAGEIVGWRVWRYSNGLLWSLTAGCSWQPGELMTGEPDDHGIMGVNCYKGEEHAIAHANLNINLYSGLVYFFGPTPPLPIYVHGSIQLWGQVVEHEDGYRGEYARIRSLEAVHGLKERKAKRVLAELREKYL